MFAVLQTFALVVCANAAPVLAALLLGSRLASPLDAGWLLRDGRPLLGRSKTWRGVVATLVLTPLVALLLGLSWTVGLIVALGAMFGDILSSYLKRRLGKPSSAPAALLDQVPESLIPVILIRSAMGLSYGQAALVVVGFTVINLALTPVARWLQGLRRGW
ncbi:hypothetical protein CKO25_03915 [Thiocapsa imhoffii]|uniref:CDP-archaeol synthase n=1 Tax=Thiocapsa imhoffii TaxID=382777 RepID=A0A9X1B7G3_9GAMM|nr:CDP-archaeol synthase [Thiocapsa imhoffii]MBK1643819.1 hypothetical protein [Thiocapsa imhoffii]